jgi:hypothetical protein
MVGSGRGRRQRRPARGQQRPERRQELREQFRERLLKALSEEPKQPGRARLRKARLNRFQRALEFRKEWLASRHEQLNECETLLASIKAEAGKGTKPKQPSKKGTAAKGTTTKTK